MLGIHGKSNQQRRKEDKLKEERTPELYFQFPLRRQNKKDAEQEVIETYRGRAAQFLQDQFLEQRQKA